jgi:hypothetical protein
MRVSSHLLDKETAFSVIGEPKRRGCTVLYTAVGISPLCRPVANVSDYADIQLPRKEAHLISLYFGSNRTKMAMYNFFAQFSV